MTVPQEKKGKSIQSRLVLLLLLILIPVLAIQAYMYYDSYQVRRASELQANLEIARVLAKAFESFVQDVIHQELAIGLAITYSQPMTSKDITQLLETSRDYVAVRDFTWLNPKGVAVYSSNPDMIGKNYSDRSYFSYVANGRVWMVSELVIAKTTGEPVFGISRGIRNSNGALLGIVFAAIIPEKLDARLAVERSKGGGYAIVDNKGMLVYRYPAINATWEERNWLKSYPEFEEALKGKEIATTVYAPFEGKNRLVGFTPVSSIGWAASAGKREEDVTRPILISIGKSALLFLSVLIAAFLVALTVSRKITSPITELRAHVLALGHGKVPEQVKINNVLEFQDLAEAFNTMAEKVQAREMDLKSRTKQLEEANKELESFSYSVSHDLRAPLRAIDGYARMILKKQGDKFDEETRRRFNEIRLNTQMMGKLVDDLLAFSRLGRKDMSMSKIDMEALIGDVWKELQAITPDRNINLTVNSMPSAYADRTLIKQVYSNLLANAVKFTKFRDSALIEVGGYVDGNDDVYYVKDNGVGFDMQYYDKLFGVFQRLHKPDDFEGTGIGLATVHRIINRHGGRVWAEGIEGEGATFYFSLPPPQTH